MAASTRGRSSSARMRPSATATAIAPAELRPPVLTRPFPSAAGVLSSSSRRRPAAGGCRVAACPCCRRSERYDRCPTPAGADPLAPPGRAGPIAATVATTGPTASWRAASPAGRRSCAAPRSAVRARTAVRQRGRRCCADRLVRAVRAARVRGGLADVRREAGARAARSPGYTPGGVGDGPPFGPGGVTPLPAPPGYEPTGVGSRAGSVAGGHGSPRSRARSAGVWIGGLSEGVR